jgi:2-phosphoglycerate kinase
MRAPPENLAEGPPRMLLIGGHSASGKTRVARCLGLALGMPWMQVDDLRLAFSRSRAALPDGTHERLSFFDRTLDVWRTHHPDELCRAQVAAGEALRVPLEAVIVNHVDCGDPLVLEGDGILPSLFRSPAVAERAAALRAVFLVEPDEGAILANIVDRGRNLRGYTEHELRTSARTRWLFGQWLAREAAAMGLPVLEPRPLETLATRIAERTALSI